MEENKEKKVTKVSMSTCLFICSLIIICVMAFFIYKFYDDKTKANNEVTDLKNQVSNLQNTVNSLNAKNNAVADNTNSATTNDEKNTTTIDSNKSYSYSDLKGRYTGTKEINGATVEFGLSLYENGTYVLQDAYLAPKGPAGNYIIVDDVLKLNILFNTTSSVDIKKANGNLEIKINEGGSLYLNNYKFDNDTLVNGILLTKINDSRELEYFNENAVNSMITMQIEDYYKSLNIQ